MAYQLTLSDNSSSISGFTSGTRGMYLCLSLSLSIVYVYIYMRFYTVSPFFFYITTQYAYICFYICNSYRFYYSYMAIAALLLFFVAILQFLFGSSCCSYSDLNNMQTSILSSLTSLLLSSIFSSLLSSLFSSLLSCLAAAVAPILI